MEHIYRDKEDSKGCVGDCGSSDRDTDGIGGIGGVSVISKNYLAGRQRNRGIKCDPVYEYRNGEIYRNGVKVGYTPVVEPFARDKEAKNEKK